MPRQPDEGSENKEMPDAKLIAKNVHSVDAGKDSIHHLDESTFTTVFQEFQQVADCESTGDSDVDSE